MKNTMLNRLTLALVAILAAPQSARACATCYGASDSDLARGMNWGILSLLFIVVVVLSGIGSFFVYLAKRSAAVEASKLSAVSAPSAEDQPEETFK